MYTAYPNYKPAMSELIRDAEKDYDENDRMRILQCPAIQANLDV